MTSTLQAAITLIRAAAKAEAAPDDYRFEFAISDDPVRNLQMARQLLDSEIDAIRKKQMLAKVN